MPDPIQDLAVKLASMTGSCEARHRDLDLRMKTLGDHHRELETLIRGRSGDNGLQSLMIRTIARCETLERSIAEAREDTTKELKEERQKREDLKACLRETRRDFRNFKTRALLIAAFIGGALPGALGKIPTLLHSIGLF